MRLPRRLGVFSPGIRRIPHLAAFLDDAELVFRPDVGRQRVDAVVGWGLKPTADRARAYARQRGLPYLALEDGFLRSMRPGVVGEAPRSIVVDDEGMHYDATRPSRLERLIAAPLDEALEARARRGLDALRRHALSKYNHQPDLALPPSDRPRVLVVDQTAGDLSITLGRPACDFATLLARTLDEHPAAELLVKTHPDVLAGKKSGHFGAAAEHPRVRFVTAPAHAPSLLAQLDPSRDRVVVLSSLVGFEALVHGLPVTCFGVPWYAGWGLTDDRADVPPRRDARSLEALFAAAYLRYARYVDPETGLATTFEATAEQLGLERRLAEITRGTLVCVGFSRWKRAFLPSFLRAPGTELRFAKSVEEAAAEVRAAQRARGRGDGDRAPRGEPPVSEPPDSATRARGEWPARDVGGAVRVVSWGTRDEEVLRALAERVGVEHWRMEDGFLRSVGLGSDLHAPASLVLDREGLYYDPTRPSELERILRTADFSAEERTRAAMLRARIVATGVSKYNVGRASTLRAPVGRRVALVVGQVEDDASIQRGCLDVRTNLALLDAARQASPDSFLIWRPHPDVISGNRRGAVSAADVARLADTDAPEARLVDCLAICDEVHTMTSLVGFEALLRDKQVFVYGHPFYAGWGLTHDRHPHPRRTRRLDLDGLVAGVLLRYPRYVSPASGRPTTPERVVAALAAARRPEGSRIGDAYLRRQLRKLTNLLF